MRRGWPFLVLCCALLLAAPAQEKKLTVYAAQTSYSIAVNDRDGKEYVGLVDLLEPLGTVKAKGDGKKWRLRFAAAGKREIEAQFTEGKTAAKVRGKGLELASRFLVENGRGMVPVHSLQSVLGRFFDSTIEFHESGRRLFLGSPSIRYSAELKKMPARLVLSFTSPVNPFVATEPGKLRMIFSREPVVAAAPATQSLDDRTINELAFNETNGGAELIVSGTAPLLASFSNGGKTITVTAAPAAVAQGPPRPQLPTLTPPPAPIPALQPIFMVVIDPGHGGNETGAALGDMAEKDFDLALARRLRAEFEGRGIRSLLLRDGDTALSLDQRALMANGAHAAVFISIHAAMAGTGVRVYTSDLPASGQKPGNFLTWETAQSAYLDTSSAVAAGIASELARRQLPAVTVAAPVRPLNNVAAAAVAIEVAPPVNDARGLASPVYQQTVCSAIGGAVAGLRPRLEAAR